MFWVGLSSEGAGALCVRHHRPLLLLRWREKVAHFSTQLPFKTAGFWGKSPKSGRKVRLGVGAEARPAATEMGSQTQVHSHATIRAKLK